MILVRISADFYSQIALNKKGDCIPAAAFPSLPKLMIGSVG